ncbi:hypothetical protein GCM10027280_54150 [Micromonospora polyrhachis]|uniref:DUF1440 domain-containing protein n=1 Tax=Micromonospora polyrhachis TaxID=1282883 RepID=A0A7W7SZS6_9ACTN|nr:hypothetical protein [Micromonospora polyrhachis]MBB4962625.1 hypothetical protein [Micromonospora polyrhachis]
MTKAVPIVRGAMRGAIAAMAMSGLRQLTTSLGLVERIPPESVLLHTAPGLLRRIPVKRRSALVEVVHWSYGLAGGVFFGVLPRRLRRWRWAGPAYGFLFWAGYGAAIAPLLGISIRRGGLSEQLALLADHLLYGSVVGAAPWLHQD